jgi:hypothetical protein
MTRITFNQKLKFACKRRWKSLERSLASVSLQIRIFPGCGSAWKKPSFKII